MKIKIDETSLNLTPEEVQALKSFAASDKQYTGAAHLIETHLDRLIEHCLKTHPNTAIKAAIEVLQEEANARVEAEIAKMRSARPLEASKKAKEVEEVVVSNL